jgi:hypothetical protein
MHIKCYKIQAVTGIKGMSFKSKANVMSFQFILKNTPVNCFCILFNEVFFSDSDYISSNEGMVSESDLERMWKEVFVV